MYKQMLDTWYRERFKDSAEYISTTMYADSPNFTEGLRTLIVNLGLGQRLYEAVEDFVKSHPELSVGIAVDLPYESSLFKYETGLPDTHDVFNNEMYLDVLIVIDWSISSWSEEQFEKLRDISRSLNKEHNKNQWILYLG